MRRLLLAPVPLLLVAATCSTNGPPPNGPAIERCGFENTLFAAHDVVLPPRSNLAIGARMANQRPIPLDEGLQPSDLRVAESVSQLMCSDSSRTAGRISFALLGIVKLGGGGSAKEARAFVLDSMRIHRVESIDHLDVEIGQKYLWEGIELGSFSLDVSQLSGVDADAAADRIKTYVSDISIGVERSAGDTLHVSGQGLFVAQQVVGFEDGGRETLAEAVRQRAEGAKDVRLGPYDVSFAKPGAVWQMVVDHPSFDAPKRFEVTPLVSERPVEVRRRNVGGSMERDRIRIHHLDLRHLTDHLDADGMDARISLERQTVRLTACRWDDDQDGWSCS